MRILIVGAGPAGATAALELARGGHEVILFDKSRFPRAKTCGSGVSPYALKTLGALGLADTLAPRAYEVQGLLFTGENGRTAALAGGVTAWVVPRSELDATIAQAAERAGARFEQEARVQSLLLDPRGRVCGVAVQGREVEGDLVLVADGAHSRFSVDPRPRQTIATIMAWYEGVPFTPRHMEMWFTDRLSPWYAWLFPETETRVNVGLCYRPDDPAEPHALFEELTARYLGSRLFRATRLGRLRGAPILYADEVGPVARPGALYLGEAARLTHSLTGEGIGYALRSARLAVSLVSRHGRGAVEAAYQREVGRVFGPRLGLARLARAFRSSAAFGIGSRLITSRLGERAVAALLSRA